jgi:hypothetical protein
MMVSSKPMERADGSVVNFMDSKVSLHVYVYV